MHFICNKKTGILTVLFFFTIGLFAQSTKIDLDFNGAKLKVVLKSIEKQVGKSFFYEGDLIEDLNAPISIFVSEAYIEEVVDKLFNNQLQLSETSQHLVLKRKEVMPNSTGTPATVSLSQETPSAPPLVERPPTSSSQSSAQQRLTVTGTVMDAKGEALPGVSVSITGTNQIVSTGVDGHYSIMAPANGSLTFAMIGMVTQNISVNNRALINVSLLEDITLLEDVVVVAYGTQKKENLSGAVSVVNVEKALESRATNDVALALQGATPGLTITTTSGELGGEIAINLRSNYVSMGQGNATPLILIDNVEVPSLSYLNPNDIESISTLKDAASTAILGSRAANGAILITTKKGARDGKINISYNGNFSWGTKTKVPVHSRPDQELEYSWLQLNGANLRNGLAPTTENSQIGPVKYGPFMFAKVKEYFDTYGYGKGLGREMVEGRDFEKSPLGGFYFYRAWDVEDLYYEKWAPQQTHNVSVSGGTESVQYNVSFGYLNQQGILKQFDDYFERMNFNGSLTFKVNKYLTLRTGYMFTSTEQASAFNFGDSATYDAAYYVYRWFSSYPLGTYNGLETRSGLAELKLASQNPTMNYQRYNRLNFGATVNIMSGLALNINYTSNYTATNGKIIGGIPSGINTFDNYSPGQDLDAHYTTAFRLDRDYIRVNNSKNGRNTYNANLTYDTKFRNHNFKVIVGSELEDSEMESSWARRDNVNDYNLPELNLAGGNQTVGSDHTWWSTVGFFGRINYEFGSRYLLEVNFRRDASSKFRKEMRWASYPSASAAWRVSEESFWKPVKPYVNSFKIRGSYGSVGNQSVPSGLFISSISQGANSGDGSLRYWLINGSVANWVGGPSGTSSNGGPDLINPDLTWETQITLDIGVDMRFWKDKFGLTADWYQKRSVDLITQGEVVPSTVGANAPRVNYGELTTKGIEFELSFNHVFRNGLRIGASAQYWDYKTVVSKFASGAEALYDDDFYQGKVMGEIWGYKVERYFTNDDFVWENGQMKTIDIDGKTIFLLKNLDPKYQWLFQPGNSGLRYAPGDIMYKDMNGDGIIDYGSNRIGDTGDRTVIGNSQPRHQYSFKFDASYKGFDFMVFFQGVGKRDVYGTGNMIQPGHTASEANFAHTLDYWTEDNPNAFYPRPANGTGLNFQPSDKYLLNMAYLRCKSLTLGYSLPKAILQKAKINRARLYFTAENLFEFDNLGNITIDPEMDWTSITRGSSKSFGKSYPYRRTLSFGFQVGF